MSQSTSVRYLKGVGPKRAKSLAVRGINTIEDLFYYFPRRYEDRTDLASISGLKEGQFYTVKARVLSVRSRSSWRRRSFSITEAIVTDETGSMPCVWFNQPYLNQYLKAGLELILYGKLRLYNGRPQMDNPEFEFLGGEGDKDDSLNTGRIVPVYTLPGGFSQRSLRRLIKDTLDEFLLKIHDCLPFDLRSRNNLLNLAQSLSNIHFPQSPDLQRQALVRLSFEEFLIFQLPLVLRKLKRREKRGIRHSVEGRLAQEYISVLPFKLTFAQEKVLAEIKKDMAAPMPMQRLLQGDVGSGKTVVATVASLIAVQGGYQAAFMAPTEVLARQHYEKVSSQLSALVSSGRKPGICLLTGRDKDKQKIYRQIRDGEVDLVIGTHALLEKDLKFKKLGFVVIDEQHKFGVGQRALLPRKGDNPDVLIMTATPIPRTLAITLYGDMDISVINQLPPGRLPVKTMLFGGEDKAKAYAIVKEELNYRRQAYIIYPVIEESYAMDIAGAKKMFAELKEKEFKGYRLGLIHGKLKQAEQQEVMLRFKKGELDLLVSTTILEVGIDIPGATCMIIESAERFGLSQLHQLRGRIGRGSLQSFCMLISGSQTEEARLRLQAMVACSDGFRIAEEDLKIRGPGEFFGSRQHGLSELKIANPLTQMQLLKRAREEALKIIAADPRLSSRQNALLKERLLQRFPEYENFMAAG